MPIKLNDLQLILLSHAARSEGGNVLPLPDTVTDQTRAHKELKALLHRGLFAEAETSKPAASWRSEEDLHFGLIITENGKEAIGLGEAEAAADEALGIASPPSEAPAPLRDERAGSKIANVLALLRRPQGATLPELIEATGWLAHTTRAALTGLRKKGHGITRAKRDDIACYHITGGN
jgi:hypothetical protein